MPGLDLSQVSTNWKKLQGKLQSEKKPEPQNNDFKRKRPVKHSEGVNGFKKVKTSDTRQRRLRTDNVMGVSGSKQDVRDSGDASHAKLADQHDISRKDISAAYGTTSEPQWKYVDEENGGIHPTNEVGKYVAMDCEMVGTGAPPYDDNVLARVSLVNFHCEQIYDSYVLPPPGVKVEDYRTFVSGIKPSHLVKGYARPLPQVLKDVAHFLDGRILVGHALWNDLQALLLSHPKRDLRDTSRHPKFRIESQGRPPALRYLARSELGMVIQSGEHSSIEDARAAMMLFKKEKAAFEEENRKRFGARTQPKAKVEPKALTNGTTHRRGKEVDHDSREDEDSDLGLLEGEEDDELAGEVTAQSANVAPKKKRKKKKRTKHK